MFWDISFKLVEKDGDDELGILSWPLIHMFFLERFDIIGVLILLIDLYIGFAV